MPAAYHAIERHPRPAEAHPRLTWQGELPASFQGCLLSNEFFDALPVHRVAQEKSRLLEIYVAVKDGAFAEVLDTPSTPALAKQLADEGVSLGEGWRAEVCLLAGEWMRRAASAMQRGYAITIDYGDMAEDLYAERRRRGTLMAYLQHTPQENPYARADLQDMTAHVDFTALIESGKSAGLQPAVLMTQHELLRNLGAEEALKRMAESGMPQSAYQANAMAVRDLLKLDGLGNFRALIQAKGAPAAQLACLGRDEAAMAEAANTLAKLPVPALTRQHMDLLAARYPHQAGAGES
jgi:SAM-dependent MidA family methyltransferase